MNEEVGPWEQALKQHIEDHGITRLSVSWGPDADKISREDRAKKLLESLQRSAAHRALPKEDRMLVDIKHAYEALGKITKLCQVDIRKWFKEDGSLDPEFGKLDSKIRGEIFCLADMAALQLGNWVRNAK